MDGSAHLEVGRLGEDAAAAWYAGVGYRVLARNWRCPAGEVDLVLIRRRTVVFCEVKCRRGSAFGGPFEAVGWRKQRKLRTLAETFLLQHEMEAVDVRFDVASVLVGAGGACSVHVFEGAF